MNYNYTGIESQVKVCSICLSIGTEHYILEKKFEYMINTVAPQMHSEISEDSYSCHTCLKVLIHLYKFKLQSLKSENQIHLRVIKKGYKINISEMLYPSSVFIIHGVNICRVCFRTIENGVYSDLLTQIAGISIKEMLWTTLPELKMDLTYGPVFCEICTSKLKELYVFNNRCMETEKKIKAYLEYSGISIKKSDKKNVLLKVTQYIKKFKNNKSSFRLKSQKKNKETKNINGIKKAVHYINKKN